MSKRGKPKPIKFRVYPDGQFLYAEVFIWPTKKAMYATSPIPRNYEARCGGRELYVIPPKRKGRAQRVRKMGLFAELHFHKRALGIEVVSHEFTHAAFCWAERRKLDLNEAVSQHDWKIGGDKETLDQDGVEERFCYVLGRMCRQFTQKCYDVGLYEATVESKT